MTDDALIEALKALAHPLRFQILEALRSGELNVGEIEQRCDIGQPALSQQLGVLRRAGLVETRKSAKLVFYSRNQQRLAELGALIGGFDPENVATADSMTGSRRTAAPGVANFARMG